MSKEETYQVLMRRAKDIRALLAETTLGKKNEEWTEDEKALLKEGIDILGELAILDDPTLYKDEEGFLRHRLDSSIWRK
jgi:hypothetical protein